MALMMAYQIASLTIVYSTVYSGADQIKHHSSASLAFVAGNSPGTGEFPTQMASNAENVSIWWRHHDCGWGGGGVIMVPLSLTEVTETRTDIRTWVNKNIFI